MIVASTSVRLRRGATLAAGAGLLAIAAPAAATHNLIANGSFETGDFTGFNHIGAGVLQTPARVVDFTSAAITAALGEVVPMDDAVSADTDAPGTHGVYFVDNLAGDESLLQLTGLHPGNYEIGFDVYVPASAAARPNDATLTGSIIGVNIANFAASQVAASRWYNFSGVASVTAAGQYLTSFSYSSFGQPAKTFLVDKVYVQATTKAATYMVPPTPMAAIPEPEAWMLMLSGFAFVGTFLRRRAERAALAVA